MRATDRQTDRNRERERNTENRAAIVSRSYYIELTSVSFSDVVSFLT